MAYATFILSDSVAEEAATAFSEHERRIRERLPGVQIRHRGGTSNRGVLTSGDVDLHVRTDPDSFEATRDALCNLYEPLFFEAWHSGAAFFVAPGSTPAVEVALTAIGSVDDFHHGEAWDRIAADPELISRYNALKLAHESASTDDYRAAKRAFFSENFG